MQTADAGHEPEDGAVGAVAERFTARDDAGHQLVIERLNVQVHENALGGLEWAGEGASYRLQGGGAVQRMDESTFRITETGALVRREEGQHGITHHPAHQTPARP